MNTRKRSISLLAVVGTIALLSACFGSSPSSRFYTLTPHESSDISAAEGMEVVVKVGPISIPSYLDRRQIVTRNGRNGIEIAEFERWGGSLDDEMTRLLVNGLSEQLAGKGIAVAPWRSITLAETPAVYQVPVSIERFDGVLGENVVLNATWAVVMKKDKQENVLKVRESTIRQAVEGKGYNELVAAMGKSVERLGKEIADNIPAAGGGELPK
jgi:hypothetical protein